MRITNLDSRPERSQADRQADRQTEPETEKPRRTPPPFTHIQSQRETWREKQAQRGDRQSSRPTGVLQSRGAKEAERPRCTEAELGETETPLWPLTAGQRMTRYRERDPKKTDQQQKCGLSLFP